MKSRGNLSWVLLGSAVASLAWLGWSAFDPRSESGEPVRAITLWTAGAAPALRAGEVNVALPEARTAPATVPRVPDAACLRRAYPELRDVRIVGRGVDEADAAALAGLRVTWEAPAAELRPPGLTTLEFTREIVVGQRPIVRGGVTGGREAGALSLQNPDGSAEHVELDGERGEVAFEIAGSPAVAAGRFTWMLRLGAGEAVPLGVRVAPPVLPRVLILQDGPSTEAARLQRWLADAGARVTARTKVSAEHFRWTSANGARGEFAVVAGDVLGEFDVVLTTERALAWLSPGEVEALVVAVRDGGLGLVVTDEPYAELARGPLVPWSLPAPAAESEPRRTRLRLADGTALDEPVAGLPAELPVIPQGRAWARDPQERTLVAEIAFGRGTVARSLVTASWGWLQRGRAADYALYWSRLLGAVARREGRTTWRQIRSAAPCFVGEPLRWVRQDGSSATHWAGAAGWNTFMMPDGEKLEVHVQAAEALPILQTERRRAATARLVALAAFAPDAAGAPRRARSGTTGYLAFAAFVASAGALWVRERRGRATA